MPGTAQTNKFMLGTATVMVGPTADLYDLNPTDHSIGLVKNFSVTSEPTYTELTQGVQNELVYSVMTSNPVRASMEVYEYTSRNLHYALGLDGSAITELTVTTAVNGAVTALDDQLVVDSATGLAVGDYIMIIKGSEDDFVVRKISAITGTTLTVSVDLPAIPDNSVVRKVTRTDVGAVENQPFFSAKIAGTLADGTEMVILIPKVRVTKGFNLAFSSDQFVNLPFEFSVYDLVNTDDFYAEFDGAKAMIFKK